MALFNGPRPESEYKMYTKGKWEVSTYEGGWDCVRDENDAIICKLVANEPANASRICQCVNCHDDLLDACKMAHKALNTYEPCTAEGYAQKARIMLVQAIAKAEGKE